MNKLISILLVVLLLFTVSISAYATEPSTLIYEHGNRTFIFEENNSFDEFQKSRIINMIMENEKLAEPCGLACLFGHNYEVSHVTSVTHCVSDIQPRCLQEIFKIQECTRCGKTTSEQISSSFITCCG